MAKRLWTGEAAKIRRRTLTAIDRRTKKRVGESDLGKLYYVSRRQRRGWNDVKADQTAFYAAALGVSVEEAAEKVAAHERHLAACGQPFGA